MAPRTHILFHPTSGVMEQAELGGYEYRLCIRLLSLLKPVNVLEPATIMPTLQGLANYFPRRAVRRNTTPTRSPHTPHLNCPPNLPNTPNTVANRFTCKNALAPMFPHITSLYAPKSQKASGPRPL